MDYVTQSNVYIASNINCRFDFVFSAQELALHSANTKIYGKYTTNTLYVYALAVYVNY